MNAKLKKLFKDTGLFAISSFGSKILLFLLTPLYTSILASREYGIADLISTTVSFVYPIFTLAIADAVLRFALDKNSNKNTILMSSLLVCVLSTVFLICLLPLYSFIDPSLFEYWVFFCVYYFLFNVHNCFSNFIKGIGKTKLFAIQGIINTASIIICNILFLLVYNLGLIGYLLSILIGFTIPIIVIFFFGKLHTYLSFKNMDWHLIGEMLKYSLPMIPTLLAWTINTSIDKYMIIKLISIDESGIYSVAHKIPAIFTAVLSIFTQAWQLFAISGHGDNDEEYFFTNIYKCLDFLSVFGCILVICLSKFLAYLLFANEYFVAWRCVPMLVVSAMFASHSGFLAAAFRAEKKTKSLLISVLIGAFVNIFLNLLLINNYGIVGASIATATSFFIVWFIRIILVQKIVKIRINIFVTVLSYILFFGCASLTILDFEYSWVVCIAACAVVCLINFNVIKDVILLIKNTIIERKVNDYENKNSNNSGM